MYDYIEYSMEQEIKRQKHLHKLHETFMDSAPDGHLNVRNRKSKIRYIRKYDRKRVDGKYQYKEESLTNRPDMLQQMVQKVISEEIILRTENNINALKRFMKDYRSVDIRDIKDDIDQRFLELIDNQQYTLVQEWLTEAYHKNPDLYENNQHPTSSGYIVSSRGETIIAEKLSDLNIPFHHDEAFPVPFGPGYYYYTDFTIYLPNGEVILWEHLGIMEKEQYTDRTVAKLRHYHRHGAVIGKNLILSVDVKPGVGDAAAIDQIIRTFILPHFQLK